MRIVLRKMVIIVFCIFLTACGARTNDPPAPTPDLSHTNPAAVKTVLEQEITGEITIYSYSKYVEILKSAASVFMKEHPNTKVNIKSFELESVNKIYEIGDDKWDVQKIDPEEDAATQAKRDYLLMVSTELMAGNGPDIILTDIIPWFRYADMGYFEDLRVYMEQDAGFNTEDYRMNVINAMEYRGGVYSMPISYGFNYFTYDATFFDGEETQRITSKDSHTFTELMDAAADVLERYKENPNVPVAHELLPQDQYYLDEYNHGYKGGINTTNYMFGFTGGKYNEYNIFRYLLGENYGSFVDLANKRADFDGGAFEKLLLSVTDYVKNGYIQEESEINDAYLTGESANYYNGVGMSVNPNQRFLFKLESYQYLLWRLQTDDKAPWNKQMLAGFSAHEPFIGNDDDDMIAGLAADYKGDIPFKTRYMYAINSNSKNKNTAWEFIKTLLSDEIQNDPDCWLGGIPINRSALEPARKVIELRGYGFRPSPLNDDNRQDWENYLKYLDELSDRINTYALHDDRIDGWIEEEVSLYFMGEKSAKDVAKALQNKISLYLSE